MAETKTFALRDWPSGYKFYDHHKGQLGGAIRHDVYLVGAYKRPTKSV